MFRPFSVAISDLSALEIISQYYITGLFIKMAAVHLFVPHAGKCQRMANGKWYSIRVLRRQMARSGHYRWITDLKYDESDMGEAQKPSGIIEGLFRGIATAS
jgi:hypothetical protein